MHLGEAGVGVVRVRSHLSLGISARGNLVSRAVVGVAHRPVLGIGGAREETPGVGEPARLRAGGASGENRLDRRFATGRQILWLYFVQAQSIVPSFRNVLAVRRNRDDE